MFKTIHAASFESFLSASSDNKIYHATLGPRDCLYLPAGYIFVERIGQGSHYVGVLQRCLVFQSLPCMEACAEYLISIKKQNATLQAAIEFLNLEAPGVG